MFSFENKVAIVTGGANGIGANLVREFLKENIKYVAIIDIDVESGKSLQEEMDLKYNKGRVTFFKCDITKEDEVEEVFNKVIEENDSIDLVVNNAASANESPKMYKQTIDINFTAVVTTTLKALNSMRVDKGGKGGTIINISSIVALSPTISAVHVYSATKAAVMEFSTRMGMDLHYSRTKVRVLTVCFGATDTKIMEACCGMDYIANEHIETSRQALNSQNLMQCPTAAARGLVYAYKNGESASSWLVQNNETVDISEELKKSNANFLETIGLHFLN